MKNMKCLNCGIELKVTGGMFKLPIFNLSANKYEKDRVIVIECPDRNCAQLIGISKTKIVELSKNVTVLDSARHTGKSSRV